MVSPIVARIFEHSTAHADSAGEPGRKALPHGFGICKLELQVDLGLRFLHLRAHVDHADVSGGREVPVDGTAPALSRVFGVVAVYAQSRRAVRKEHTSE